MLEFQDNGQSEEPSRQKALRNFGTISKRDELMFGCASPLFAKVSMPASGKQQHNEADAHQLQDEAELVDSWLDELVDKNKIKRFLIVLTQAELQSYKGVDLVQLIQLRPGVVDVTHVANLNDSNGLSDCLKALYKAFHANDKLVMCDFSGQVRTGILGTIWIHHKYFAKVEDALKEVVDHGKDIGTIRRPILREVLDILLHSSSTNSNSSNNNNNTVERLMLSSRGSVLDNNYHNNAAAWGTPRSARSVKSSSRTVETIGSEETDVLFIATGGTIDKDYPRATSGYGFEIGHPAVHDILKNLREINGLGFTYNIVSVCRKDSQDLTDTDREAIWRECKRFPTEKIVITHGTDTIIETGKFLQSKLQQHNDMTIILTGAVRPAKFTNSDAPFNIGVSIGALWTSKPGVHLCMNGKVFPVHGSTPSALGRDPITGLFTST